jgi:Meiotically up-regulated gene 113
MKPRTTDDVAAEFLASAKTAIRLQEELDNKSKDYNLDAYLSKYNIHYNIVCNESITPVLMSAMICSKLKDEDEFGVSIHMRVSFVNSFGKEYIRESLFINDKIEVFVSHYLGYISSEISISAALTNSYLYFRDHDDDILQDIESVTSKAILSRNFSDLVEHHPKFKMLKENYEIKGANFDRVLTEKYKLENKVRELKKDINKLRKGVLVSVQKEKRDLYGEPVCYIMIDGQTNYVKIGFSRDPEKREKTLQSEKPTTKLLHVFKENHERHLHKIFADRRVRGEWFSLEEDEVSNIIASYN